MNRILYRTFGVFVFLLIMLTGSIAQTTGTLSFSVTTTSTGGYTPSHLLAIWIENGSTSFVKTKIKYAGNGDLDHMQTWVTKSGQNVVDAVTGPTLTSHGTITFLWNGTNTSGTLVPDGSYFVWLEMAWASNLTTGKTVNSFQFTKGASVFHSNPANTANLLSMSVDWTPSSSGVDGELENKSIKVYPNPTSGLLNIEFKIPHDETLLSVIDESGKVVYNESLTNVPVGLKTLDLTGIPSGSYFCRLRFRNDEIVFRVMVVK
jgi:hypothetical protein